MRGYSALLIGVALALQPGAPRISLAEEGQYRSKVLLSPDGEMDKGAELSVKELEQQIDSIIEPYAKSSAGRHLARHYVEQGEYLRAIEYYQEALAAEGLSDIANREMLRELAQIYLLTEDYSAAVQTLERVLHVELIPEVTDYLLLAKAHHRLGKYVAVVATLDRVQEKGLRLNAAQMGQVLALYYRAGAYAQCESLLQQLLKLEPDNPDNWHLLVSVYLQQNKKRQALDQLTLAREKSVSFTERDILLLVDLQAANKNPYTAAEILSAALAGQEVNINGENYRKLFEFWFLAREKVKAQQALAKAAQLTGDTQLYLYLAQLQMDQQFWQAMHQTMLAACTRQLQEKYLSRANLLLGVSQLKLGDTVAARRSFINATLIGGATAQAGQWLNFMNATPATSDELRRIVGVCYGDGDKRASEPAVAPEVAATVGGGESVVQGRAIQTKTVPPVHLYYIEQDMPVEQLVGKLKPLAARLNISLVKAGGTVNGSLHIISFDPVPADGEDTSMQVAFPVRGVPTARGRYKARRTEAFKCAYLVHEGPESELAEAWARFAAALVEAGYKPTGERRVVADQGTDGRLKTELQLGIY